MQVNVPKLKGKMTEKEKTGENIAEELKMNPSTYYRKLKGGGKDFTLEQVFGIVEFLNLTPGEAMEIFWGWHPPGSQTN